MGMLAKKLGTIALGAVVAGATLSGAGMALVHAQRPVERGKEPPPTARRDETDGPVLPAEGGDYPGLSPLPRGEDAIKPPAEPANARRIAVGDTLVIEVLDALPGRQIIGERVVRPDRTVSLGFYGDVELAGLTRLEAKVKVIDVLRPFLTDQQLGLVNFDPQTERYVKVHPAKSNRVYVDDSPMFDPRRRDTRDPAALTRGALARPDQPRPTREAVPGTPKPGQPKQAAADQPPARPATFKAGDRVIIEVLDALPGRQILGDRIIRPDGTVGLGFYGDLGLAGLTRQQAKLKAIEHLRQWLSDEMLGLVAVDEDGVKSRVAPERSTHIFVEEVDTLPSRTPCDERLDEIEHKLDRVLNELEALRRDKGK